MAKIAISLPDKLFREIERERRQRGESRSEFLRKTVEAFLRQKQEREAAEQYVTGYRKHPETEHELRWVETASQAVLAEYPWNDDNEARG